MDHAAIDELAGAIVLGALTPDEAREVADHLRECPRCARRIAELRAVARLLPEAVEPVEAPPTLKARVLAAALADERSQAPAEEAPLVSAEGSGTGAPHGLAAPIPSAHRGPRWREHVPPGWAAAVAALLLISAGLGYANVQLQMRWEAEQRRANELLGRAERSERIVEVLQAGGRAWALQAADGAAGAVGAVAPNPGGASATVVVHDLAPPPPDADYQLWVIRDGTPHDAGLLRPDASGLAISTIAEDPTRAQVVAVTLERKGGSPEPRGPVVLKAQI